MRNRLLPLAVLAIALGLAAAAYADISVTTVIVDPAGVSGTYDVRAKLWGDTGIGTDPTSGGYYDFTVGVNNVDGAAVQTAQNVAPQAAGIGFCQPGTANNGAISGTGVMGILSWQNALTTTTGVLPNCGIAAGSSNGLTWDADTRIATGTYSGSGSLSMNVPGRIAFSVLPSSGLMTTIGPASWVTGVVTQTIVGSGNNGGGAAYTSPTAMTVQAGEIHLGASAVQPGMAQNLTLNIDSSKGMAGYQEDATVVLDASQSVSALNINYGQAGFLNGLDLNGNSLKIYSANLDATETSLIGAILNAQATPGDGLYDETLAGRGVNWTIGLGRGTDANGNYLIARTVEKGDFDCDGNVGPTDLGQIVSYWNPNGTTGDHYYWQGNADYDNTVGPTDLGWIVTNWAPNGYSFAATGGGLVPEPCTMILMSLGALGLIRRKRS